MEKTYVPININSVVDFYPKAFLILYPSLENSSTGVAITNIKSFVFKKKYIETLNHTANISSQKYCSLCPNLKCNFTSDTKSLNEIDQM